MNRVKRVGLALAAPVLAFLVAGIVRHLVLLAATATTSPPSGT